MGGQMSDSALSVAANAVSANVYAGKQFEFPARPSLLRIRASGSATGLNVTLIVGGVTKIDDQPISNSNRWPILPDDMLTQENIPPGVRLILRFRNTTGGALTVSQVTEVIDGA